MKTKDKVERLKAIKQLYAKQQRRIDAASTRMTQLIKERQKLLHSLSMAELDLYREKIQRYEIVIK